MGLVATEKRYRLLNETCLGRVVEIEYQSLGKPAARRRIEPYAVVFYHSSLYIIAAASEIPEKGDRLRHLKLDRFRKAEALDEWFKRSADFDLAKYLGQSLGIFSGSKPRDFRIRISAYAAPWVLEDPWHPDQKVEPGEAGGIVLTVKAGHELEIIPRVLALGSEAEILSPASCRRAFAQTVRKLAEMYEGE